MTTPTYDQSNPSSIESFGKNLVKKTLRNTPGVKEIPKEFFQETGGESTKGTFGALVEKYYYGINPGNVACSPDFKTAGVELKTTSVIKGQKKFLSKERLSLGIINYNDIVTETFGSSCFMKKNKTMLLIGRRFKTKEDVLVDARIDFAELFAYSSLPDIERQQIKNDWETIVNKVKQGQAHTLSSTDTKILEAAPKGATTAKTKAQPFSKEKASSKGLALKKGYMGDLITRYMKGDLGYIAEDQELAIPSAAELEEKGLETIILERLQPFIGMTIEEIAVKLEVPLVQGKQQRASLAEDISRRMFGVNTKKVVEFERANIKIKTIFVNKHGTAEQHMSFPGFKYQGEGSILDEDWEAVEADDEDPDITTNSAKANPPQFKKILDETRFLFIEYKSDSTSERLNRVKFWSMPPEDIEAFVRPVWQKTYDSINTGELSNLPEIKFNHKCHVRPHGPADDKLPAPHNEDQIRRSFWLDKQYIQSQMA